MKSINLLSLLSAKFDLDDSNFLKYIEQFGINPRIRTSELEDLKSLVDEIYKRTASFDIMNGYYVGFMINQIGKEFDLLRIGENYIVNIELKRESSEEKVVKQLIQNQYYLKFLDVAIYNYTYISSTKKLYALVDSTHIEEVDFQDLIEKLNNQIIKQINDLNELFDPTNYLVSPFNSPDAFIGDKYFLSAQQSTYKREIFNLKPNNSAVFIAIKGGPGTGKTLLTYDIAKDYLKNDKKVLIFNCGKLNNGHSRLISEYHWPIQPISNYQVNNAAVNLAEYEIIIFDEAQRIYKNKLLKIIELIKDVDVKCIFSFDPDQCITEIEIQDNIPKLIEENLKPVKYELTTIIRHNKEISAFINNFFDLSRVSTFKNYKDVSIQYFSSKNATIGHLQYMRHEGWKIIDYTLSGYIENPDNDHSAAMKEKTNETDGQEFDYLVAVIDDTFYYKPNHKLAVQNTTSHSFYDPTKMLFQNISRTRKKLHVVIVNNAQVLNIILGILK